MMEAGSVLFFEMDRRMTQSGKAAVSWAHTSSAGRLPASRPALGWDPYLCHARALAKPLEQRFRGADEGREEARDFLGRGILHKKLVLIPGLAECAALLWVRQKIEFLFKQTEHQFAPVRMIFLHSDTERMPFCYAWMEKTCLPGLASTVLPLGRRISAVTLAGIVTSKTTCCCS